jgi:hypothetical protein
LCPSADIFRIVKRRRMGSAGYVTRMVRRMSTKSGRIMRKKDVTWKNWTWMVVTALEWPLKRNTMAGRGKD